MDEDDVLIVDDKNRKDLHGRAKDWEAWVGGWMGRWCSVSWSLHICIFTFFTELRRITPWLRHIQDLSSRVWVLHNDVLTVVPRKEQTVPGEKPRPLVAVPLANAAGLPSAFHSAARVLVGLPWRSIAWAV